MIPFTENLHWNEEITFNSLISEISCDYCIQISLIRFDLDSMTGTLSRREFLKCKCPVFDSSFQLYQGDLNLHLDSDIYLNVEFQNHGFNIKYELDRPIERPFLETFDMETGIDLSDSSLLVPFLRRISFENQWVIYESRKLISQWEKPEIHEIVILLSGNIGLFVKSLIIQLLEQVDHGLLTSLLPFLIHCVKFDSVNGVLVEYLLKLSVKSKSIGNQLFWLLKTESIYHQVCKLTISKYLKMIDNDDIEIIRNQCLFFDSIEERKTFELNYQVLMPFTMSKIKTIHKFIYPETKIQNPQLHLELDNGTFLELIYYSNSPDIYSTFAINNFINIIGRDVNNTTIGHFVIGYRRGFVIIPDSLKLVQINETGFQIFSELCKNQKAQTFAENFTTSLILEMFIAVYFNSNSIDEFYINEEGGIMLKLYSLSYTKEFASKRNQNKFDGWLTKYHDDFIEKLKNLIQKLVDYLKKTGLAFGFFTAFTLPSQSCGFSNQIHLQYFTKFLNEDVNIVSEKILPTFFSSDHYSKTN
ncbi:predicted protein [Naegleria gruberi]|uniref:Predicted protein n=1 Tax=Naegleria gruberi TaxID=5762 RepID=D2VZW7_NAEGR|nr:uncharacterized protein NAEGRDRAFT_74644 [Naegleria gruberi]EFC37602.1 predicted protein [Naegleria gruberi]|eukprot:XP_002670346.1 predicted protein [Naegleria gruberi strain NEG-M]